VKLLLDKLTDDEPERVVVVVLLLLKIGQLPMLLV
jgi:hypothetical protein